MARKKISGVYAILHPRTNSFYIGSSVDVHHRFLTHMSELRRYHHSNWHLWALYEKDFCSTDGFELEVLEECAPEDLEQREDFYLRKYVNTPGCLNAKVTTVSSMRGKTHTERNVALRSQSMVGKNRKADRKPRPKVVTFISPDGIEYKNVTNVAQFARDHGLHQSALTAVLYGRLKGHRGWTATPESIAEPVDV